MEQNQVKHSHAPYHLCPQFQNAFPSLVSLLKLYFAWHWTLMGLGTDEVMHNFVLLYCSGRIFMHMLVLFGFFKL